MSCGIGRRQGLDPTLLGSCRQGVGHRRGLDPTFLWLWFWRRPVATAPIRPLAWEPPYAAGAAQEIATTTTTKRQKTKKKKRKNFKICLLVFLILFLVLPPLHLHFFLFLFPAAKRILIFLL